MKTSELQGAQLDYWAAFALGAKLNNWTCGYFEFPNGGVVAAEEWMPSTNWAQGGPIIEREKIMLAWDTGSWAAEIASGPARSRRISFGPTPLIAAMRCLVASKYGDEVPDEQ